MTYHIDRLSEYPSRAKATKAVFERPGIRQLSKKVTHIFRGSGARMANLFGASVRRDTILRQFIHPRKTIVLNIEGFAAQLESVT
jgi:hypothetical protein